MGSMGYEFLGLNEILAAFEARGVMTWAVFAGTRFIMKGEGDGPLRQFLEMIGRSNTSAIYTLKVYEELPENGRLNSKTPDDGSFNFKLFDPYGNSGGLSGSIVKTHYGDPGETERLKVAIREVMAETDDDETPSMLDQVGDALIGMLQEPRKLSEFIGALTGQPPATAARSPHIVGQIPAPGTTVRTGHPEHSGLTDETSLTRIGNAIELIAVQDPKIVDHLEQLATMAKEQPGKFKMLIALLDQDS